MRFAEEMKDIALRLELYHGFNVLQCVYNPQSLPIDEVHKEILAQAHYQKIMLSNAVYIVDIDGYIGASVKKEIDLAKAAGKELIFHSQFQL